MYGSEIWVENKGQKSKLRLVGMNYLRSSAWKSKKVRNEEIRQITQAEEAVLDRTEISKLKPFEHLMRMPQERWPAKIRSWIPPGRIKRRRPRQSWRDGVTEAMEEKEDVFRRRTAPDTLEKRTGLAVDCRISQDIYIYIILVINKIHSVYIQLSSFRDTS
jgi:hypothetical protein